jgi:hypothetical protein
MKGKDLVCSTCREFVKSNNAILVKPSLDASDDEDEDEDKEQPSDDEESSESEEELSAKKKTTKAKPAKQTIKVTSVQRRLDMADASPVQTPSKPMTTVSNYKMEQKLQGKDSPKTPSREFIEEADKPKATRGWNQRFWKIKAVSSESVDEMKTLFPKLTAEKIGAMLPDSKALKAPVRGAWMYSIYLNLGLPAEERLDIDDDDFVKFTRFYGAFTGFEREEIKIDITDFRKYHGKEM